MLIIISRAFQNSSTTNQHLQSKLPRPTWPPRVRHGDFPRHDEHCRDWHPKCCTKSVPRPHGVGYDYGVVPSITRRLGRFFSFFLHKMEVDMNFEGQIFLLRDEDWWWSSMSAEDSKFFAESRGAACTLQRWTGYQYISISHFVSMFSSKFTSVCPKRTSATQIRIIGDGRSARNLSHEILVDTGTIVPLIIEDRTV